MDVSLAQRAAGGCARIDLRVGLKEFLRVQQDGDGAIVYQFHRHRLLEPAGLAAQAGGADSSDEILVEAARLLGAGCGIEGRPLASAYVAEQRKLRYQQHCATSLADRQIHLSFRIVENAQAGDLVGQVVGIGFGVILAYAQQYQQTFANCSSDFAGNGNLGPSYALDDGSHKEVGGLYAVGQWLLAMGHDYTARCPRKTKPKVLGQELAGQLPGRTCNFAMQPIDRTP